MVVTRPHLRYAGVLLALRLCSAQELLKPQSTEDLRLGLHASEQIANFGRGDAGSSLLVVGTGSNRIADARFLLISKKEGRSPVLTPPWNGQAVTVSANRVFLVDPKGGIGHIVNAADGQRVSFPIIAGVFSAVFDPYGSRLALLGLNPGASATVAVYDCATTKLIGSLQSPVSPPMATSISFAGPDKLLIIDHATFQVMPVTISADRLSGQSMFKLTGAEVEDSLRRIKKMDMPAGSARLVLEHMPGQNGRYLFFIGPHKRTGEGLRLVEFDETGAQVRSFRVMAESDAAFRSLTPLRLAVRDGVFDLLGQDGVIRTYVRP